ncbi:MAG: Fe-S cluster assembly protein SufD [Actinobacteria bacterium]|nr:Fe-S cluster assembly protein SufD [Actinomycetota bacterium]
MSALTTNYLAPHATPNGREEAWRFTPLKRLSGLHDLGTTIPGAITFVAKNALPSGAEFKNIPNSDSPPASTSNDLITNRVRNTVTEISNLTIGKDQEISEPIFIGRKLTGKPELSRLVIEAGVNSKATVIIENTGSAQVGEEIEIVLSAGAKLNFITLQEWNADSIQVGQHHALIAKDAEYNSYVVTVGGSVVRLSPTVEFTGQGATAELFGLYFATSGQHLEHRIHVDHKIANAKSRVNYKGALSGKDAHTVWIGDVFIHKGADGTDTYELNRNLLLTDGARADSVPNLEIETGEIVGAGHASTTGRFDDEQLFYLQSRGIPADIARRLVIRGFFAEIVTKLKNEEIEERIMNRIDAELAKVGE